MDPEMPFGYVHQSRKQSSHSELSHSGCNESSRHRESPLFTTQTSPHHTSTPTPPPHLFFRSESPYPLAHTGSTPRSRSAEQINMASTARRSTGPSEVIDLTGDSPDTTTRTHSHSQHDYRNMPPPPTLTTHRATRPPRGFQEIIDLSDADESPMRPGLRAPQDDSPEVEFVGERTIPLGQREQRQRNLPTIIDFITFPNDGDDTDDDDEVEITHVHHFREIMGPGRPHSFFDRLADRLHAQIHAPLHAARGARQDRPNRRRTNPRRAVHHAGFVAPDIDYAMAAFDMGMGSPPLVREPTPEAIIPPDPAPEGFTRDPREDDVLVCPSCGDELCQGGSDEKAQPWLIKTCGHVYCGHCAKYRARSKPRPAGIKVTPWKKCKVENCTANVVNHSSMIPLWL